MRYITRQNFLFALLGGLLFGGGIFCHSVLAQSDSLDATVTEMVPTVAPPVENNWSEGEDTGGEAEDPENYDRPPDLGHLIIEGSSPGSKKTSSSSDWTKICVGDCPEITGWGANAYESYDEQMNCGARKLNEPLVEALAKNGRTVDDYNNCIKERVMAAGPGTRGGVVNAAVALMECLDETTGYCALPYDHTHGKPQYAPDLLGKLGVNSRWGELGGSGASASALERRGYQQRKGVNCATSVRWAFCNGGMDACRPMSAGANTFAGQLIPQERAIFGASPNGGDVRAGKPGDVISMRAPDHVGLIVGFCDNGYNVFNTALYIDCLSYSEIQNNKERRYRIHLLDAYYASPANQNNLYGVGPRTGLFR